MRHLAEAIRDQASEILETWDTQHRAVQPYLGLDTRDDRLNSLVHVITTLAFASVPDQARAIHREALDAAAEHGLVRRQQGFTSEALQKECYGLRHALWAFLREREGVDAKMAADAILRIDQAVSLTWQAALLAFHRPELEESGAWPEALDRLIHLAPFLAPLPNHE